MIKNICVILIIISMIVIQRGTLILYCFCVYSLEKQFLFYHDVIWTSMRGWLVISPHLKLLCGTYILWQYFLLVIPFNPWAVSHKICSQWSCLYNFAFGCIKGHFGLFDQANQIILMTCHNALFLLLFMVLSLFLIL